MFFFLQVILPLMKSDLYEVLSACVSGDLAAIDVKFDDNLSAVGVVMASNGYPESSSSGLPITGVFLVSLSRTAFI